MTLYVCILGFKDLYDKNMSTYSSRAYDYVV